MTCLGHGGGKRCHFPVSVQGLGYVALFCASTCCWNKEMPSLDTKSISASVEELADSVLGLLGICTNLTGWYATCGQITCKFQ